MVSFEKTDACLLIVIVASISYLYLSEDGNVYVRPADVSENEFDAEASDSSSASSRKCPGDLSVTNQLVLDFSYSSLSIPNATKEIGEKILDQLFTMCTCDLTSTKRCFQWTVVIDQLDYAKTRHDDCTPSTGTRSIKSSIGPEHDKATVAKIYIQQQSITSSPTTSAGENSLECFRTTANAAIMAALPHLDPSSVETILATQVDSVKVSSNCKCSSK